MQPREIARVKKIIWRKNKEKGNIEKSRKRKKKEKNIGGKF